MPKVESGRTRRAQGAAATGSDGRGRRPFRGWFWIAGLLLGLSLVLLMLTYTVDAPPPEDALLRQTWAQVDDADNGRVLLELALFKLGSGGGKKLPGDPADLKAMAGGRDWDRSLAERWSAAYAAERAALRAAHALPFYQAPPMVGNPMNYKALPFVELDSAMQAQALYARLQADRGSIPEAIDEALVLVELGSRMELARGTLIEGLIGTVGVELGLATLRDVLAGAGRGSADLAPAARRLGGVAGAGDVLASWIRGEYTAFSGMIDHLPNVPPSALGISASPAQSQFLLKFFVKPNRTRREAGERFRLMLDHADKPYDTWPAAAQGSAPARSGWAHIVFSTNPGGNWIKELWAPEMGGIFKTVTKTRRNLHRLQLWIAVERFRQAEGRLPADAAELVPEFLPAVPLDPFDGKPIRYDPAAREVGDPAKGEVLPLR